MDYVWIHFFSLCAWVWMCFPPHEVVRLLSVLDIVVCWCGLSVDLYLFYAVLGVFFPSWDRYHPLSWLTCVVVSPEWWGP